MSQEEDGVAFMEISAEARASLDIDGPKIEDLSEDSIVQWWKKEHMDREQGLLKELENFRSSGRPSSKCCIFRVPEKLQKSYCEAYTPRIVSIGPYHYRNQSLRPMYSHKELYLGSFLRHSGKHYHDYIVRIESWMEHIKSCYGDEIHLSSDVCHFSSDEYHFSSDLFAEMMLLDGSFMIQLFLIHFDPKWRPGSGDQIFDKPWMLNNVRRDLLLLENQIPFFVVQGLFEMAYQSHPEPMPGLLELAYGFFSPVMMTEVEVPETVKKSELKHFLDAIRFSYLSSARMLSRETQEEIKFIPNARDLVGAGVKLRKSKSKCSFDIKFQNGVLEIPPLNLYRVTESYFRNVIAFEQCYYEDDSCLIDYLVFIDQLVNIPADAKLLIDKGIIENWLGGEHTAADLINSYCKDSFLWPRDTYFNSVRHDLMEHYQKPYNQWKATFKRDYCSSPWKVLSVIAALVLLALTFVQTVCSLLSTK